MSNRSNIQNLSDALLNPPDVGPDSPEMQAYFTSVQMSCSLLGLRFVLASRTAKERAIAARNLLVDRVDVLYDFLNRAKNAGLNIPSNPFSVIYATNTGRALFAPITWTDGQIDVAAESIRTITKLYADEQAGILKIKPNALGDYAQISSFAISAGNSSVQDASNITPDEGTFNRALEALTSLDFTKRVPRVLFTADYSPDGVYSRGSLIGWRKIPDASGYVIKRHDVFKNTDVSKTISNADLIAVQDDLAPYVETWLLSFYEVDKNSVYFWLDDSVEPNSYYTYKIGAYQKAASAKQSAFVVKTIPARIQPSVLAEIHSEMSTMLMVRSFNVVAQPGTRPGIAPVRLGQAVTENPTAIPRGLDVDDVSPYPHIAKKLYGNSQFDWLIAAVNVKAAFDRKESIEKIRSFSYVGAKFSSIVLEMNAGKFLLPQDPGQLIKNIETSIMNYGTTRTVIDALDASGMLFYFEEKEQQVSTAQGGVIASILSAIDAETATIDPKKLGSNLLLQMKMHTMNRLSFSRMQDIAVSVPPTNHTSNDILADDAAQFVGQLSTEGLIDLTTYAGISQLIRTIRTCIDFSSTRAT